MYNNKLFSDVTFIVRNKEEIFGHRAIIGTMSHIFLANFSNDVKDKDEVKLEDVNVDVSRQFSGSLTLMKSKST